MTVAESPSEPRFKLKLIPILVTVALGYGVPYVAGFAAFFSSKIFGTPSPHGPTLPWLYIQHGFQLLLALIVIAVLKFRFVPADYCLHWPRGKTYIWPAILWGCFFGVLMTLVDYAPQLMAHSKPNPGFPLTPSNIGGWLFFEGIYVGPTEEIPFRALLVTFLATTMPGKLHIGRFNMNWAGVIVALIFALLHANNSTRGIGPKHWGSSSTPSHSASCMPTGWKNRTASLHPSSGTMSATWLNICSSCVAWRLLVRNLSVPQRGTLRT